MAQMLSGMVGAGAPKMVSYYLQILFVFMINKKELKTVYVYN